MYGAITLEHLWWIRNKVYHEGMDMSLEQAPQLIRSKVNEMIDVNRRDARTSQRPEDSSRTPFHGENPLRVS